MNLNLERSICCFEIFLLVNMNSVSKWARNSLGHKDEIFMFFVYTVAVVQPVRSHPAFFSDWHILTADSPFAESGGYFLLCPHLPPPTDSWASFLYFWCLINLSFYCIPCPAPDLHNNYFLNVHLFCLSFLYFSQKGIVKTSASRCFSASRFSSVFVPSSTYSPNIDWLVGSA